MTTVAVCGGGIGGLATAIALHKFGLDVTVYEQTRQFARVGADINLTPNAVRALDGLGIGPGIRESAARPQFRISRTWDTGAETSRLPMGDSAEQQYGAPQQHGAQYPAAGGAGLGAVVNEVLGAVRGSSHSSSSHGSYGSHGKKRKESFLSDLFG